jgi:hypothetical protein
MKDEEGERTDSETVSAEDLERLARWMVQEAKRKARRSGKMKYAEKMARDPKAYLTAKVDYLFLQLAVQQGWITKEEADALPSLNK